MGLLFQHTSDTLSAIYRNDIATGEGAEDISEAVGNMEEELCC